MDNEKLNGVLELVEREGSQISKIIKKIVNIYTKELNDIVERIQNLVNGLRSGEISEYSNEELELDIIEISTLMYSVVEVLIKLGGESDIAKLNRQEEFDKIVNSVGGTIKEKEAKARRLTIEHQAVEDAYKRAYDQVKRKVEQANEVYNALKKVYGKRVLELDVFRKEIRERRFDEIEKDVD